MQENRRAITLQRKGQMAIWLRREATCREVEAAIRGIRHGGMARTWRKIRHEIEAALRAAGM